MNAGAWGSTGHRAVAQIAWEQLTDNSKQKLKAILGDDYIPLVATWADDIRSDKQNPLGKLPHYVNMPFDQNYESSVKNPDGDLVTIFNQMVEQFKNPDSTNEQKAIALKIIIHLVGDVHQPMHIGLAEDLGGNKVEISWMGKPSNLHKLWDEELIDYSRLSYTELARFAGNPTPAESKKLKKVDIIGWVDESHELTKLIYDNLGNNSYSYEYYYQFSPVVLNQIQKAGYRLGYLLNDLLQ